MALIHRKAFMSTMRTLFCMNIFLMISGLVVASDAQLPYEEGEVSVRLLNGGCMLKYNTNGTVGEAAEKLKTQLDLKQEERVILGVCGKKMDPQMSCKEWDPMWSSIYAKIENQ